MEQRKARPWPLSHRQERTQASKRRRRIVLAAIFAPLLAAGAAGAAWLLIAQGSANFTDTTGSAGSITVVPNVSNATDALTPGATPAPFSITIPNPSANPIQFDKAPVVSVTSTSAGAACDPTQFVIVQPKWSDSTTSTQIAAGAYPYSLAGSANLVGTGNGGSTKGTIQMTASAPQACQSVTVNIAVTVAP